MTLLCEQLRIGGMLLPIGNIASRFRCGRSVFISVSRHELLGYGILLVQLLRQEI